MPNAGSDKQKPEDPKKPAATDLEPPVEEEAAESTGATAQPDKRTWQ